jgi:hypothetical protein
VILHRIEEDESLSILWKPPGHSANPELSEGKSKKAKGRIKNLGWWARKTFSPGSSRLGYSSSEAKDKKLLPFSFCLLPFPAPDFLTSASASEERRSAKNSR